MPEYDLIGHLQCKKYVSTIG